MLMESGIGLHMVHGRKVGEPRRKVNSNIKQKTNYKTSCFSLKKMAVPSGIANGTWHSLLNYINASVTPYWGISYFSFARSHYLKPWETATVNTQYLLKLLKTVAISQYCNILKTLLCLRSFPEVYDLVVSPGVRGKSPRICILISTQVMILI